MVYNNGNNKSDKSKGSIVVKSDSDEMRAFYDFCMDFLIDDNLSERPFFNIENDLLSWCEEPEMMKMALFDIKNRKKKQKP